VEIFAKGTYSIFFEFRNNLILVNFLLTKLSRRDCVGVSMTHCRKLIGRPSTLSTVSLCVSQRDAAPYECPAFHILHFHVLQLRSLCNFRVMHFQRPYTVVSLLGFIDRIKLLTSYALWHFDEKRITDVLEL